MEGGTPDLLGASLPSIAGSTTTNLMKEALDVLRALDDATPPTVHERRQRDPLNKSIHSAKCDSFLLPGLESPPRMPSPPRGELVELLRQGGRMVRPLSPEIRLGRGLITCRTPAISTTSHRRPAAAVSLAPAIAPLAPILTACPIHPPTS